MENGGYSDQMSPSHFMLIFFDHDSFQNTKNHYYELKMMTRDHKSNNSMSYTNYK